MHQPLPHKRARGFTLIELLTVIAIIGILAAIIIPTVGRVRESANAATCVSNLRQIAVAVQLYTNERGHFPPSESGGGADGPAGRLWQQNLRPYMNASNIVNNGQSHLNSRLVLCPSRGLKTDTSDVQTSYSANPNVMPSMNGTANANNKLVPFSKITRPTETILMGDACQQASERAHSNLWQVPGIFSAAESQANEAIPLTYPSDGDGVATFMFRHSNASSANVVFVDGHARNMKKNDILYRHVRTNY